MAMLEASPSFHLAGTFGQDGSTSKLGIPAPAAMAAVSPKAMTVTEARLGICFTCAAPYPMPSAFLFVDRFIEVGRRLTRAVAWAILRRRREGPQSRGNPRKNR